MTDAEIKTCEAEILTLAHRVMRDALAGPHVESIIAGALAERVLALAATVANSGDGNMEEESEDG